MRRSWLRSRMGVRLLIQTTTNDAVEGVLSYVARDGLVLIDGFLHREEGGAVALAGTTFVPREKVRIVQELPPRVGPS